MQLLLEDELLRDDEDLFEHWHDGDITFGPDLRGGLDHLVDGPAGDLDKVTLQVGFDEFFSGVCDGADPNLAHDDLPLVNGGGLFDEWQDLFGL
jgi:hypothetical protein